jgi:hypothetical protein
MIGVITSRTRDLQQRPVDGPVCLNTDCAQAEGLVAFWPLQTLNVTGYRNVAGGPTFQPTVVGPLVTLHGPGNAWAMSNTANEGRYLDIDGLPVSAPPFTVAAWFHAISATQNQVLWSMGNAAGTNYFALYAGLTNNAVSAGANAGAGEVLADSSALMVASTWHHGCVTFTSATARAAYLDGGGKGTNATSCTPTGVDRCRVGVLEATPTFLFPLRGRLAHVCVWNVVKTDEEVRRMVDPATRWELYYQLGRRRYVFQVPVGGRVPIAGARGAMAHSLIAGGA